jgi:hypothetical protein
MDPSGDDHITQLLRLKRYERPPPGYFENFLHEFRRRQRERDELLRQPLWQKWFERVRDFAFRPDVRPWVSAGAAAVFACAAVISLTIYRQPDAPTQLAVRESPVPSTPSTTERELDLPPPPVLNATFDMRPTLRPRSTDIRMLPADPLPSYEFVPLQLEWGALDD